MALKPCSECGDEVSDRVKTCPNCGIDRPVKWPRPLVYVLFAVFVFVMISIALQAPEPGAGSADDHIPPDPAARTINAWITSWSDRQAAEFVRLCRGESGCDTTEYVPAARPETSFGWDSATSITRTDDWARGPRYHATANGRRLLLYLEGDRVVGVFFWDDTGLRRTVCQNEDC